MATYISIECLNSINIQFTELLLTIKIQHKQFCLENLYFCTASLLFITDMFSIFIFSDYVGHHHIGLAISLQANGYIQKTSIVTIGSDAVLFAAHNEEVKYFVIIFLITFPNDLPIIIFFELIHSLTLFRKFILQPNLGIILQAISYIIKTQFNEDVISCELTLKL